MLTRRTLLQAHSQIDPDVIPTFVESDCILMANAEVNLEPTLLERNIYRDSISAFGTRVGKKMFTCSFEVELKGRGTVPTVASPIEQHALLLACGFIASEVAGVGVMYKPTSDDTSMVPVALRFNLDGVQYLMANSMGNLSVNLTAGAYGVMNFNFTGLYNAPSDMAMPTAEYRNATEPPIVESCEYELDGFAGIAEMMEFDMNNEITERPDLNSPEGLKGLRITARNVGGTVNPEMVTIATHDYYTTLENSTKVLLKAHVGSVVGNRFDFNLPEIQITGLTPGDRNGIRTTELEFVATGDDSEVTILAQ